MYCIHCGREIDDTAEFCPYCGGPQDAPVVVQSAYEAQVPKMPAGGTVAAPAAETPHHGRQTDPRGGSRMLAGFVLGLVVALAAGGAIAWRLGFFSGSQQGGAPESEVPVSSAENWVEVISDEAPDEADGKQGGASSASGGEGSAQEEAAPDEAVTDEPEEESSDVDSAPLLPPEFSEASASSTLPPDGVTSYYGPYNAVDGDFTTAWSEGASGDGLGEWIQLSASTPQRIHRVSIVNGYPKTEEIYYYNNRPKDVTITLSDGYEVHATLSDLYRTWQTIEFDTMHETTYVRLTVDSVYNGTTWTDMCLCEFQAG